MKKNKKTDEIDYYTKRDNTLFKRRGLSEAFLRPPYQYTKLENNTIEKLHELDYLK